MQSYLCSWIGRVNIVKMTVLMKPIYILNVVPIKFPMVLGKKKKNTLLKFVWNHKVTGDLGLTLGFGRFPGGGNGNLLWFSCLEKSHGQKKLGRLQSIELQKGQT